MSDDGNEHHHQDAQPVPDPGGVHTPGELAAAMDVLRKARGLSYAGLEKAARPELLPASTVSDLLSKGRPSVETLVVFLRAYGIGREQEKAWLAARERALSGSSESVTGAVRVEKASARLLGVHKPIAVKTVTPPCGSRAQTSRNHPPSIKDATRVAFGFRASVHTGGVGQW